VEVSLDAILRATDVPIRSVGIGGYVLVLHQEIVPRERKSIMQSRKLDTMHVLELQISDSEIANLMKAARSHEAPAEVLAFLESVLPEVKDMKPGCFGVRDQIDINDAKTCAVCALLGDCVTVANAPVKEAPPEPQS